MTPTGEATAWSPKSEAQWQREVDRCRDEIAAAELLLLAGHPDVEGLCMAQADWSAELSMLEAEAPAAWYLRLAVARSGEGDAVGIGSVPRNWPKGL